MNQFVLRKEQIMKLFNLSEEELKELEIRDGVYKILGDEFYVPHYIDERSLGV